MHAYVPRRCSGGEPSMCLGYHSPSQSVYEGGRSFVNCVSENFTGETCVGAAKDQMGECRMDIIKSEMAYLGFFDSESYGLTWKVCKQSGNRQTRRGHKHPRVTPRRGRNIHRFLKTMLVRCVGYFVSPHAGFFDFSQTCFFFWACCLSTPSSC